MRDELLEILRDHEWQPEFLGCSCRNHGAVNIEQHHEHVVDLLATVIQHAAA